MLRLGEVLQLQDQCATDRPLHCKGPTRSDIRPMSVRLSRPPNAACKGRDSVLARGGRVQAARTARGEASEEQEDFSAVYRHTFLSVGYSRCGKSAFRENLQKQSKWYDSIFTNDLKHLRSTFGVDSITVSTTGSYQSVEMNLMELGGAGCFSLLQGLLPTRRVTFVVCFSLRGDFSFEHLMPFLQFILCQTTSRDTTVILIGTHLDRSPIKADKLALFFLDIEKQVSNYFRILQPVTEKRPAIVGSFAVDNVNRTVFSPLFGRLKKFPELLSWLGDQAIQRCRNDSDFPNAQVPRRLLSLCKKTRELNREGKWCISSLEFKTIARVIDSRYGNNVEDLHRHMQLLMSWGVLHHHYRHHSMKKYVVVDTPWVLRAVAVLSCCTSVVPEFSGSVAERRPMPLVLCRDVMQSMQGSLPFDGDDVLTSDVCGVLLQGVVTMRTAMALFRGVLKEKDYSANQLGGLLELLRSYDLIIMGSRLQYSSFYGNASVESVDGNASDINRASSPSPQPRWQSQRCDVDGKDARGSYSRSRKSRSSCSPCGFQSEQFIIIPACFMHQTPSVLSMHLPTLLGGPFYRFTLDMVPHNFFARITCRVAHCAEKVYLGPVSSRRVPLEDLLESSGTDDATKRAYSCGSPCGNGSVPVADSESDMLSEPVPTACFVNTSQFWDSTMWVVSNSRSRALLRMVQRSLFITFHDLDNNTAFYDGVRHVVRSIVGESPGVACRESIMCARRYLEEDEKSEEIYGDGVYWRDVDENINSLEKIKNREASALMTARGLTPRLPTDNRGRGAKLGSSSPTRANHKADGDQSRDDEEIIPFMRDLSGPIDVDSLVQRISADAQSGDALLGEVRGALRAMKEAREGDNPAGECRALDWLVDVLAQA
uniref:WGS project CAEQ00000000 data, annotated contig 535 n=1 Tax=Trypanosoma congolense (strain IL3000) TaxID=1068625 RepID=F9WGS1_TRYCI|nr:unnamed protein product [Trypanosoma congolense IL3000]